VAQTISEFFHHVRCELRVLLNEKMEPPLIDCGQSASGLRHSVGSTRIVESTAETQPQLQPGLLRLSATTSESFII
jgi:hypothetical protein